MHVLGEVYCFGASLSGLGFWSYFRGCLGAQGRSASWDGMGGGWPFCRTLVERLVCFVFSLSTIQSRFIWYPLCRQYRILALARGISGWRSPGPRRGKAETLLSWSLPNLSGVKPSPGRGVVFRGGAAFVLLPGQDPNMRGLWRSSCHPDPGPRDPTGQIPPATPWPASDAAGA